MINHIFLIKPRSLLQNTHVVFPDPIQLLIHILWIGLLQHGNLSPSSSFNSFILYGFNLPFSIQILHSKRANSFGYN